jgi:hypothetical protein
MMVLETIRLAMSFRRQLVEGRGMVMDKDLGKQSKRSPRTLRHHAIIAGCFGIAAFLAASSSAGMDPNTLIEVYGTLDRSFKFTPAKLPSQLPGNLEYCERDIYSAINSDKKYIEVFESRNPDAYKHGYVDPEGRIIVKPKFNTVTNFSEGLAGVTDDHGRWGYINTRGDWVIKPSLQGADEFEDGVAAAQGEDGSAELIDKTGRVLVKDDYAADPPTRLGHVFVLGHDYEKVGLVDTKGKWLLPKNYEHICAAADPSARYSPPGLSDSGSFHSGGYLSIRKNKVCGVADSTGHVFFPPKFDVIRSVQNGHAVFFDGHADGVADLAGRVVIPAKYQFISAYDKLMAVRIGHKWFLIDGSGNPVSGAARIDGIDANAGQPWLSEGLGRVLIDGKFGFLDDQGRLAIKPSFQWASDFSEGYATVWEGGSDYHFINRSGDRIGPRFASIKSFKNGIARVSIAGPLYDLVNTRFIGDTISSVESSKEKIRIPY